MGIPLTFEPGGAIPDRALGSRARCRRMILTSGVCGPVRATVAYLQDEKLPASRWRNRVVFTSERHGSADIFRVRSDGMGLERLTDDAAYDDQAALSPDGDLLAFVSTRDAGSTDVHILDLKTGRIRNLTHAPGGDFRPRWSPDGKMLAFSSDRGWEFEKATGRWEHVHPVAV